jgi:hypothetical protein
MYVYCMTNAVDRVSFPEIEAWKCDDLIEKVRGGDCLSVCEDDMPQPASGDSYNQFARRYSFLCLSDELFKRHERRVTKNAERRAIQVAEAQAKLEKQQRARQRDLDNASRLRREAEEATKAVEAANKEARRAAALGHGPPSSAAGSRSYWALVSVKFDDEPLVSITPQARLAPGQLIYLEFNDITVPFIPGNNYLVPLSVADCLRGMMA